MNRAEVLAARKTPIKMKNGKPFYSGTAKAERLQELGETAVAEHNLVNPAKRDFLNHARAAGKALIEAYRIIGHSKHGNKQWSRWLDAHWRPYASRETARTYRRIARNWDHPAIVAARDKDLGITSIRQFLLILRGKKKEIDALQTEMEPATEEESNGDSIGEELKDGDMEKMEKWTLIGSLIHLFKASLKELDLEELRLLEGQWDIYWHKLTSRLQRKVQENHEHPDY
jgi:hypothetical protein